MEHKLIQTIMYGFQQYLLYNMAINLSGRDVVISTQCDVHKALIVAFRRNTVESLRVTKGFS